MLYSYSLIACSSARFVSDPVLNQFVRVLKIINPAIKEVGQRGNRNFRNESIRHIYLEAPLLPIDMMAYCSQFTKTNHPDIRIAYDTYKKLQ